MVSMPAVIVITGASGAGKTTLTRAIGSLELPGVACFQCDSIYYELPDEVRSDGEAAQDAILKYWLKHVLAEPAIKTAILETQIRPHKAKRVLRVFGIEVHQIVLVECEHFEREARLVGPRGQPELASPQMENWAAYLRGQADAMELAIIDTSKAPMSSSLARLREIVESLVE